MNNLEIYRKVKKTERGAAEALKKTKLRSPRIMGARKKTSATQGGSAIIDMYDTSSAGMHVR